MNRDDPIAVFGYGSLVNARTHRTPVIATVAARLKGWRRVWRGRTPRGDERDGLAFLSIEPAEGSEIDGVLMLDRAGSLPALDGREALYDRSPVERAAIVMLEDHPALGPDVPIYVYVGRSSERADAPPRILGSYLQAVLQGYEHRFGPHGPAAFLASTANGALDVLHDDERPLYPRAVHLSDAERERYRALLAR